MKGRAIPFNMSRFKDAEITPQKVKGALFSIIGENLQDKVFIDLFSGSGQIGFEALSRKCSMAVFNERDRARFEFIKNFTALSGHGDRALVLNLNAKAALKFIYDRGIRADFVFLDPPYDKETGGAALYDPILKDVEKSGILKEDSEIVIQHFSGNELSEVCGELKRTDVKKYGSTSLSIYR
ncbi:MAG: hypothetical protein CVV49_10230, partial [Spirochaetae bacterium HGW-Spirochaetae-5]